MPISYKKLIQILHKKEFYYFRNAPGSHEIWYNEHLNRKITVPQHKEFPKGTLASIAKKAGSKNLQEFLQTK